MKFFSMFYSLAFLSFSTAYSVEIETYNNTTRFTFNQSDLTYNSNFSIAGDYKYFSSLNNNEECNIYSKPILIPSNAKISGYIDLSIFYLSNISYNNSKDSYDNQNFFQLKIQDQFNSVLLENSSFYKFKLLPFSDLIISGISFSRPPVYSYIYVASTNENEKNYYEHNKSVNYVKYPIFFENDTINRGTIKICFSGIKNDTYISIKNIIIDAKM